MRHQTEAKPCFKRYSLSTRTEAHSRFAYFLSPSPLPFLHLPSPCSPHNAIWGCVVCVASIEALYFRSCIAAAAATVPLRESLPTVASKSLEKRQVTTAEKGWVGLLFWGSLEGLTFILVLRYTGLLHEGQDRLIRNGWNSVNYLLY